MNNSFYVQAFIFWIACGFLGAFVGNRARRSVAGFLLGFIFGPLGMIAAFALKPKSAAPPSPEKPQRRESSRFYFKCHKCDTELSAEPWQAGQEDRCGKCRTPFVIPSAPRKKIGQEQPRKMVDCEDCGREISRRATSCPHCGAPVSA